MSKSSVPRKSRLTIRKTIKLSREGKRIVRSKARRIEVMACPGSGKTTVLALRCRHLIEEGQDPQRILVLSFSNPAVETLQARLSTFEGGSSVRVQTCHAFALQLIRENLAKLGMRALPALLEPSKAQLMLASAASDTVKRFRGIASDALRNRDSAAAVAAKSQSTWLLSETASLNVRRLATALDTANAAGTTSRQLVTDKKHRWMKDRYEAVKLLRLQYRANKKKAKVMDYADFIRHAVRILAEEKKVRGLAFDHLLIDEYQDTNPGQAKLFAHLAEHIRNVMAVGDPNQAIFGFAGANYKPLSEIVDNVKSLPLSHSFRLPQPVADAAVAVISENSGRRSRLVPLITARPSNLKPTLVTATTEAGQAAAVVTRIRKLLIDGVEPDEIAVLSRITSHLRPVTRALQALRLNVEQQGHTFDLHHVVNVLRLVRLIEQVEGGAPIDANAIAAQLEADVEPAALKKVVRQCRLGQRSKELEGRYIACLKAYLSANGGLRHDQGLRRGLADWAPMCREFESASKMMKALDRIGRSDAVHCTTIHQAKGKEWQHVFLIGATDGVLPDYRSTDRARLLEERNLMYVAITRTKASLTIIHAPQTLTPPHKRPMAAKQLSQFLDRPGVLKCFDREAS